MAENIVVNGVTYNGVDSVEMQNTNGKPVGFYPDAVRFNPQDLTDAQKAQARNNIGITGTGKDGQRGTGLLAVTTAPSSYTTAVGGITPKYRMAISTIKTQSGVTEVLLGDTVRYSYYHYPIAYLDASYAYFTTRVSIRGAAGTTPVKGTDYWTEADKEEIVQQVIVALGTPVFGRVDAYKNIILTGELADGTYTIKYEDADGVITEIGMLNHTVVPEPTWTNVIPLAVNTDGSPYIGTNGENGYKTNTRLNSSIEEVAADGIDTTGYIEATLTDTFYFYNIGMFADSKKYRKIVCYDANFAVIANGNLTIDDLFAKKASEYLSPYLVFSDDGNLVSFNLQASAYYVGTTNKNKIAYIRFVTSTITEDSIITKNETID